MEMTNATIITTNVANKGESTMETIAIGSISDETKSLIRTCGIEFLIAEFKTLVEEDSDTAYNNLKWKYDKKLSEVALKSRISSAKGIIRRRELFATLKFVIDTARVSQDIKSKASEYLAEYAA